MLESRQCRNCLCDFCSTCPHPLANSAILSMLTVDCRMKDEMVRERNGHPPSYAEAKKMKVANTSYHQGWLKDTELVLLLVFLILHVDWKPCCPAMKEITWKSTSAAAAARGSFGSVMFNYNNNVCAYKFPMTNLSKITCYNSYRWLQVY